MRPSGLLLVALLAVPLLASHGAAQLPGGQCGAAALFLPVRVDMAPGSSRTLAGTVENRGAIPATAAFEVTAPAGWPTPVVEPSSLPVGANARANFTLALTMPGGTTRSGEVGVTTRLTCGVAALQSAPATTTVTAVPTLPEPAPFENLAALVAPFAPLVLGIAAVGALVAAGVVGAQRRRRGIDLATSEPEKTLRPGRGTSFPLTLENRARDPDTAHFEVGGVPDGWTAFTALPEVTLGPGEKRTLWLMVRAPPDAPDGSRATVSVVVKSETYPQRTSLTSVTAVVRETAEGEPEPAAGVAP